MKVRSMAIVPKLRKKCAVCEKEYEATTHQKYCARCGGLVKDNLGSCAECAAALRGARDAEKDGFVCYYTGIVMDEKDWHSPWALSYDHLTPGEKKLVACCRVVNNMKQDMSEAEFRGVVKGLDGHWKGNGKGFDPKLAELKHWHRPARMVREMGLGIGGVGIGAGTAKGGKGDEGRIEKKKPWQWTSPVCVVCGKKSLWHSRYCARCQKFIKSETEHEARAKALTKAWSAKRDGFICHYTGLKLEEQNKGSPLYLSFDHRIPAKRGGVLLVAARFVNGMKSDLSEDEFRAMVRELAKKFGGGEFDRSKLKFRYYHRAVRPKKKS